MHRNYAVFKQAQRLPFIIWSELRRKGGVVDVDTMPAKLCSALRVCVKKSTILE